MLLTGFYQTKITVFCASTILFGAMFLCAGCFKQSPPRDYFGDVVTPPQAQELRWIDGGLPRIFDPALARAAPDTDAVRAMYEGLTDYDATTLEPVAGVAQAWQASKNNRVWIFELRPDARWSNGEQVTAHDFARSWRRVLLLGERVPHKVLLENITGVEAVDDAKLRVTLRASDARFPALVAHTVFRPVYPRAVKGLSDEQDLSRLNNEEDSTDEQGIGVDDEARRIIEADERITNGAFQLLSKSNREVILERAENYRDAASVTLERVRFVNRQDVESVLASYENGEVDLVTNVKLEPLAVKLLAPYKDFYRDTFGALDYYTFNLRRPPFDDVRVRRALALSVNREKLARDVLNNTAIAADGFLPQKDVKPFNFIVKRHTAKQAESNDTHTTINYDVDTARALLAEAGYGDARGFPTLRLLINRNDKHRTVALAVKQMWREALNIETEIIIEDWDVYAASLRAGEYDVARRSLIMQTPNETFNLRLMFGDLMTETATSEEADGASGDTSLNDAAVSPDSVLIPGKKTYSNQREALREMPAVPLYFAASYALVKPYVTGFARNLLDAPSLKDVRINRGWKPASSDSLPPENRSDESN